MKREYGIDLLKIVAMLFIVMGHAFYRGGMGLLGAMSSVNGTGYEFVNALIVCHVNCFVLCTGWLCCNREVKFRRVVNIWAQMVFYSLVFIIVAYCFFPDVQITKWIGLCAIFPVAMGWYWFIAQYFLLMLMAPILNAALGSLDLRSVKKLLFMGFLVISVYPFVWRSDMWGVRGGFSAFWFAYLYLLAGAMKIHGILLKTRTWLVCLALVLSVVGLVTSMHLCEWLCRMGGVKTAFTAWESYTSPFLVVEAVAMLILFTRIKIESVVIQRMLSLIAPSILSVYLIHSNMIFRQITHWNEEWTALFARVSTLEGILSALLISALIFSGCVLVDCVRRCSIRVLTNGLRLSKTS